MHEVSAELEFSAAHFHPDYPGDCRRMHGHNYHVVVTVRGKKLNDLGMVCDFYSLKKAMAEVISEFDHLVINDHPDFENRQPSAENIAEYFFHRIDDILTTKDQWVNMVEIRETEKFRARYYRDDQR